MHAKGIPTPFIRSSIHFGLQHKILRFKALPSEVTKADISGCSAQLEHQFTSGGKQAETQISFSPR